MAAEIPQEERVEISLPPNIDSDQAEVASQLQRLYEHILNGQRPEAVGATEQIAEQLDIDIERPQRFPARARR